MRLACGPPVCCSLTDGLRACRKLRNADAALQLLTSFKGTEEGPLAAQLSAKVTDILAQYARELDTTSAQFRAGKVGLARPGAQGSCGRLVRHGLGA